MNYQTLKRIVIAEYGYSCVVPGCDAYPDTLHHLIKRSVRPDLVCCKDNVVPMCGKCHSEIERRITAGESFSEMLSASKMKYIKDNS